MISGTRPLSTLHEGELVRIRRGREWTPAVVVKQHQATPDGTQIRRNRIHLQPTKEEAPPVTNHAWEAASDVSIPVTPSNTDMGIETQVAEPPPDIPRPAIAQADQPVIRSQRVRRAPERLIETV